MSEADASRRLRVITDEVASRVRATESASGAAWPCRAGCDACCRSLAAVPELSLSEWERLAPAVDALPADVRTSIARAVQDRRARGAERPIVCPLLDGERGLCRVYEARPTACRTYGFYADRDGVLGCDRILARAEADDAIVWGNHDAVVRALDALGPVRSLLDWLGPRFELDPDPSPEGDSDPGHSGVEPRPPTR